MAQDGECREGRGRKVLELSEECLGEHVREEEGENAENQCRVIHF